MVMVDPQPEANENILNFELLNFEFEKKWWLKSDHLMSPFITF
jgi:hypothetical protein